MNRIDEKFNALKKEEKKALITFITAGDPDIETTKRLVKGMAAQGVDLVELGIPFSDPMAEGPVIQKANERALLNDVTLNVIFKLVKELREENCQIPLVFLMYYNSLLTYGADQFFVQCNQSGVDGVIIPDLPFEEMDELREYTQKYNVHQISMVSPTSKERIRQICEHAKGFLYCVSSLGVTGMRSKIQTNLDDFFGLIKTHSKIPTCIGFGISNPTQAHEVKQHCDGVIVGSAIVNLVAKIKEGGSEKAVLDFVQELRNAI